MSAHPGLRLLFWTLLGCGGLAATTMGGLESDWRIFGFGLVAANVSMFMLGTGLFLRWPRGGES